MPEAFVYSILVLAVGAFMLWFALGTRANIAKGNRVLTWLQDGLPRLGARTKLRWLGSTAVQLDLIDPRAPFAQAQIVIVLEPRDLGWLWAWSRSRGRRDALLLRGRLRSAPRFELEAAAAEGWTARDRLAQLDRDAWSPATWDDVDVFYSGDVDIGPMHEKWSAFFHLGAKAWRLSVRRGDPHVEVHLALPDTDDVSARDFISAFIDLGEAASSRRTKGPH
jgi:hypothetical protein